MANKESKRVAEAVKFYMASIHMHGKQHLPIRMVAKNYGIAPSSITRALKRRKESA